MASQIAFPYTFPFEFHTGIRGESGAGVDSSAQSVEIKRLGNKFPYTFPFYFHEGEDGNGIENLLSLLAAIAKSDNGSGIEAVLDRDLVITESGSGADAILGLLAILAKSDSGLGVEAAALLSELVHSESGLGTEAVPNLNTKRFLEVMAILSKYHFLEEDTVWILALIRDEDKNYIAPTSIKVSIYDPDGSTKVDAQAMTKYKSETGIYEYCYHKGESAEAMDKGVWRGIVKVRDGSGDDAKITSATFSFKVA